MHRRNQTHINSSSHTTTRQSARLLAKAQAVVPTITQLRSQKEMTSRKRRQEYLDEPDVDFRSKRRRLSCHQHYSRLPTQAESVGYWCRSANWPKSLFQMNSRTAMPTRRTSGSFKCSNDGSALSLQNSVDLTREEKAAPYQNPDYEVDLRFQGFEMQPSKPGPRKSSLELIEKLLTEETSLPEDSLFSDRKFDQMYQLTRVRNETRIVRDILPLIFPSAELLMMDEEIEITDMIESTNEIWTLTEPITSIRPQPDYAVGFKRYAFSEDLLQKIRPILGDSRTQVSRFRGTRDMYFPFASCEVRRDHGQLDVADRKNAHTMFIAVRAMVHLHQLVNREQELDREVLAFSASHDARTVRIHGYYPIIGEKDITYHRHEIRTIDIRDRDGRERWTPYRFFKNMYQNFAGEYLERIRNILQELPADYGELLPPTYQSTESALSTTSLTFELDPNKTIGKAPGADEGHSPETSTAPSTRKRVERPSNSIADGRTAKGRSKNG